MQQAREEVRKGKEQQRVLERQLAEVGGQVEEVEGGCKEVQGSIAELQAEVGTPLLAALTAGERQEVTQLALDLQRLQEEAAASRLELAEVETRQQVLEAGLSGDLERSRQVVRDQIAALDLDALRSALQARRDESASLQRYVLLACQLMQLLNMV